MAALLLLLFVLMPVTATATATATETAAAPSGGDTLDAPRIVPRFPLVLEAGGALPSDWSELVPWLAAALDAHNLTPPDALARVLTGELDGAAAGPVGEPGPDVETNLTLRFPALTTLAIEGTLDVRRHDVDGVRLDAARLRDGWLVAEAFGEPMARAFLSDLEAQVQAALEATLRDAFPDATSVEVITVTINRGSLDAALGPNAPVRLAVVARVQQPASLAAGEDVAAAVLDGGARVRVAVPFVTPPGHRQSFTLHAPAGLAYEQPTEGALGRDGRELRLALDNTYGDEPLRTLLKAVVLNPLARPPAGEDLDALVELRLLPLDPDVDEVRYRLDLQAHASALDVASRFPQRLPDHVELDVVGADTLRRLHAAGLVDDAALHRFETLAVDGLRAWLEEHAGRVEQVGGGFDREDLTRPTAARFDVGPAIPFHAAVVGAYALPGGTAQRLDLALRIGGRVAFDLPLPAPPIGQAAYVLHPPRGLAFEGVENGTLRPDGAVAFLAADAPIRARFTLVDPGAAAADATDAQLDVLVDVRDVALDPFGGAPPRLLLEATLRASVDSIELPAAARELIDPRVQLTHLSSDGIRLLRAEGVLDDANLSRLEALLLDAARGRMRALGVQGEVDGGIVRDTLAADARGPVLFEARAALERPLGALATHAPRAGGDGAAALSLYRTSQRILFPGLKGVDAAYTVLLPPGIRVVGLDGTGAERVQQDGRDGFLVRPDGENSDVGVQLAVTPTFLVLKAWPLLLGAAAALAGLMALIARRRAAPHRRW